MPAAKLKAAKTDMLLPNVEVVVPGVRHRAANNEEHAPACKPYFTVPRVSRLMALAIKLEGMITRGEVDDYADVARLGYVSRARVTQIMNLLWLAPDLQERVLWLDPNQAPRLTERTLREVAREVDWARQRDVFTQI